MVPDYSRIVVLIFSHSFLFSCGLAGSDDSSTVEVIYKGETESYRASNEGKLTIIGGAVLEDYEDITFDLQINYDDASPASNAEVIYEETPDFVILQIISDADEGGSAMMVGSPLEIKDFLEDGISSRKKQFPGSDDHSIESLTGFLIGAVIIIKKGAKLYSAFRTGQAIWNTGLEVYEVSTFFVSDAIRYEAGAILYCKELNDIESLAQNLQSVARSTPRLIISIQDGVSNNVFEVIASDVGGRFEDYLADFMIDKTFRFFDDVYDLDEQKFGVKVYLPGSVLFPSHRGESPGFIEIIPEMPECQTTDHPDNGPPGQGVTDIDGNEYRTVIIGNQEWMAENLRTSRFRNGDDIPNVTDDNEWAENRTGAWAHYENDSSNEEPYGKLYNWYAATDSRGLCPVGWSVPSDAEWTELTDFLGGLEVAGGKMKATGMLNWREPNVGATNESGFTGQPGGYRHGSLMFEGKGFDGFWWSSSEHEEYTWMWATIRRLSYGTEHVIRQGRNKSFGVSVRCIKD